MTQPAAAPDAAIEVWHLDSTELTDGSMVYDVIGASDEARIVFNCADLRAAEALQAMLMSADVSGASAEAA